jgi:hypothetical protein
MLSNTIGNSHSVRLNKRRLLMSDSLQAAKSMCRIANASYGLMGNMMMMMPTPASYTAYRESRSSEPIGELTTAPRVA